MLRLWYEYVVHSILSTIHSQIAIIRTSDMTSLLMETDQHIMRDIWVCTLICLHFPYIISTLFAGYLEFGSDRNYSIKNSVSWDINNTIITYFLLSAKSAQVIPCEYFTDCGLIAFPIWTEWNSLMIDFRLNTRISYQSFISTS